MSILRSSLCVYSDAYNSVKGPIMNTLAFSGTSNNTNKNVVLENCAPFTNSISRTDNTQVADAQNIGVIMLMHNIIEYRNNCSKLSGISWQYCREENDDGEIIDFSQLTLLLFIWNSRKKWQVNQARMVW